MVRERPRPHEPPRHLPGSNGACVSSPYTARCWRRPPSVVWRWAWGAVTGTCQHGIPAWLKRAGTRWKRSGCRDELAWRMARVSA